MTEEKKRRYGFQVGVNPNIQFNKTLGGPQSEDQVPEEVRKLLEPDHVKAVMILYQHEDLPEKLDCWNRID